MSSTDEEGGGGMMTVLSAVSLLEVVVRGFRNLAKEPARFGL